MYKQITDTILMVRPRNFGFNPETAENNAFQNNTTLLTQSEISTLAIGEFDIMVQGLKNLGVKVVVVEDTDSPIKTDAVFPNNWFTTHSTGELYLFPMYSLRRRFERRIDIVNQLCDDYSLRAIDIFLAAENDEKYLEGTGSMILDRPNKLIFACYSERTHSDLLEAYAKQIGYEAIGFHAVDADGTPYYHTNVIMSLGRNLAILCTESIVDDNQRSKVKDRLSNLGKELIEISRSQVSSFAGNMLEVSGDAEKPIMVMSSAAYNSLTISQKYIIEKNNVIFHSSLETIEKFGGGSARCMMAEIFSNM